MAYTTSQIINWAKIAQPVARFNEGKKRAAYIKTIERDLDVELYLTRKDVEYEYAQDPASDNLFEMGNYLLSLMGEYLFYAQQVTGDGGNVSTITSGSVPTPYDFLVTTGAFIEPGNTTKTISSFIGYNVLFVRNGVTQSQVYTGGTYFSWNSSTGLFTLIGGAAQDGELFQIYPVIL